MISKDNIKDKLEKLELLIDKTQPDESDKEQLFQQHQIDNCDNIRYVDNLNSGYGWTNGEREHLIYIMRTSNKVWKMRNKMLDGDSTTDIDSTSFVNISDTDGDGTIDRFGGQQAESVMMSYHSIYITTTDGSL